MTGIRSKHLFAVLIAAGTFVASIGMASAGSLGISVLATSGEAAPGTSSTFSYLHAPFVMGNGDLAFEAKLESGEWGVWTRTSGGPGSFERRVLDGDAASGLPGHKWLGSGGPSEFIPRIRPAGDAILVPWQTDGPSGVWRVSRAGVELVVHANQPGPDGTPIPGRPAVPTPNGAQDLAAYFNGDPVSNRVPQESLWRHSSDALTPIARYGDAAPGTSGAFVGIGDVISGPSGAVAFGADVPFANGIWIDRGGSLERAIAAGDPAPDANGPLRSLEPILLDAQDRITLRASAGVHEGLWVDRESGLQRVVLEGQPAPGAAGRKLGSLRGVSAHPSGGLAVLATIEALGSSLLGPDGSGGVTLYLDGTDVVAALPLGMAGASLLGPLINSRGDVAVSADRREFNAVLFATGPDRHRTLLAPGDRIEVAAGDFRIVESAIAGSLTDDRQLGVRVGFEDGTNATILVTVPEPGLLMLLGLLGCGLAMRS